MSKIRRQNSDKRDRNEVWLFYCPGCACYHTIAIPSWTITGDLEKPTVRPSVLVNGDLSLAPDNAERCHLTITDGQIEYLQDSTHHLKGFIVPMWDI